MKRRPEKDIGRLDRETELERKKFRNRQDDDLTSVNRGRILGKPKGLTDFHFMYDFLPYILDFVRPFTGKDRRTICRMSQKSYQKYLHWSREFKRTMRNRGI